jgi:hypothetical protein
MCQKKLKHLIIWNGGSTSLQNRKNCCVLIETKCIPTNTWVCDLLEHCLKLHVVECATIHLSIEDASAALSLSQSCSEQNNWCQRLVWAVSLEVSYMTLQFANSYLPVGSLLRRPKIGPLLSCWRLVPSFKHCMIDWCQRLLWAVGPEVSYMALQFANSDVQVGSLFWGDPQ